jgi:hypothetical protein
MLTGREFGLAAMQSLRNLFVVNNRATMSADMMSGLVFSRLPGAEINLIESTNEIATFEAKRPGGKSVRLSFSVDDAKQAALLDKENWRKYPKAMLRARALAGICRLVFPDVVSGLYTPEEMTSVIDVDVSKSSEPAESATDTTASGSEPTSIPKPDDAFADIGEGANKTAAPNSVGWTMTEGRRKLMYGLVNKTGMDNEAFHELLRDEFMIASVKEIDSEATFEAVIGKLKSLMEPFEEPSSEAVTENGEPVKAQNGEESDPFDM